MKKIDRKKLEKVNTELIKLFGTDLIGWKKYVKEFKKLSPKLYKEIVELTPYEVRSITDIYFQNWIRNFRDELH